MYFCAVPRIAPDVRDCADNHPFARERAVRSIDGRASAMGDEAGICRYGHVNAADRVGYARPASI
jgi:hypothetical protein